MTKSEQQAYLVANLRDLHMPDDRLWWPPAPLWWALMLVLALLAVLIIFRYIWRRYTANSSGFSVARKKLDTCFETWQSDQDTASYIQKINTLLKQFTVGNTVKYTVSIPVARLSGREWVRWLEKTTDITFSSNTRALLSHGGYQRTSPTPDQQSHIEICNWLKRYMAHTKRTARSTYPQSESSQRTPQYNSPVETAHSTVEHNAAEHHA